MHHTLNASHRALMLRRYGFEMVFNINPMPTMQKAKKVAVASSFLPTSTPTPATISTILIVSPFSFLRSLLLNDGNAQHGSGRVHQLADSLSRSATAVPDSLVVSEGCFVIARSALHDDVNRWHGFSFSLALSV